MSSGPANHRSLRLPRETAEEIERKARGLGFLGSDQIFRMRHLRLAPISLLLLCALALVTQSTAVTTRHFLYVASPGIRNYVEYGGVGILVYDIDAGYKFVKRIPPWDVPAGQEAENVKGVVANARTARIYVSTPKRIAAFDLLSEKKVWDKEFDGGCDRLAISPDGQTLYVPSFAGPPPTHTRWPKRLVPSAMWCVPSRLMAPGRFATTTSTSCSDSKSEI